MAERMDDYDAGLFQESSAEDYALAGSAVALASLCHISFCHPERSRGTPDLFPRPLLCVILSAAKDPGSFSLPRPCDTCVKAAQKVHQWPQGNYISLRSGGNGGLASGRGSARGKSPSLLHGMLNLAEQRTEQSYPGSVGGRS